MVCAFIWRKQTIFYKTVLPYSLIKMNIAPEDWKYMEQSPYGDDDFSEEHNRRVIAEVDAENDRMDALRDKKHKDNLRERSESVAQYLKNVTQGQGVTDIEKYFGKRHLAYLRGEQIVKKIQQKIIDNPSLMKKIRDIKK